MRLGPRAHAELSHRLPAARRLRREIHAHPDLGGREHGTARRVLAALGETDATDLHEGLLVRVEQGPTSGGHGPAGAAARWVGLRAELDALPIQEDSGLPWQSTVPGAAHLCGHDVHAAALVAVVQTVRAIGAPAPLLALFQPREESYPSGAEDFVASPLLSGQDIRALVGVHLQPTIPAGTFSAVAGPINAAADNVDLTIRGVPAHAAYPHLGRDPVLAAAAVVQSLQHVVSRRVDPMQPSALTIGRIQGGDSHNAIPGQVLLQGTVRTYSEQDRRLAAAAIEQVAASVAAAHGCTADTVFDRGEPVLDNDAELAHHTAAALIDQGLAEAGPVRSCGADDFAWYGSLCPSLMVFAGVGDGAPESPGLHHPRFVPDDEAVDAVARIMLTAYLAAAERTP